MHRCTNTRRSTRCQRDAAPAQRLVAPLQSEDYTSLYVALYKRLLKLRGAAANTAGRGVREPAATNLDVAQLAELWTKDVLEVSAEHDTDRVARKRWLDCASTAVRLAAQGHPDSTYPENVSFWRCMRRTAIWLDSRQHRPGHWALWWDSVGEAVEELPGTLSSVAQSVGDAGSSAVDTAGDAAKSVGRGLSEFLSEPIRLVAVLVGGAILIPPVIRAMRD